MGKWYVLIYDGNVGYKDEKRKEISEIAG